MQHIASVQVLHCLLIVREPAIPLIKWLRSKGLVVCSYVEKYAKFKNQNLKKIGWYTKMLCAAENPGGRQFLKLALKWGILYHRINFDLPCTPMIIFHWYQKKNPGPPLMRKNVPKHELIWGM